MEQHFEKLIGEYKTDNESVYHTWFINSNDRLKAFRTIRSGIKDVIADIETGRFGNDFKGSSLETVVTAIAEQKQVFEGAAHAFFWKPKLRIPDIYENEENKVAFGRFLKGCLQSSTEKQLLAEVITLKNLQIKGLGPAVANILYFLHPTLFPPFNTAIVKGFNALFQQKIKLGSWDEYLKMRQIIMEWNEKLIQLLSKDLGAIGGLFFEIGIGRLVTAENFEITLENIEKSKAKRHKEITNDILEENAHTEMQYHLALLGKSLGYQVWVAQNDHRREWNNQKLGELSLNQLHLPSIIKSVRDTISLIDLLWLDENGSIICAFEVEKSTSIYSGILRLNDLSMSLEHDRCKFYLVAPNKREKEIKAQLHRPSFSQSNICNISYILFSDLRCDCEAMCKFGTDLNVLEKISKHI
ncbi:hypothetical protein [Bacillus sp. T3]|uniref:hypothetical protein n=1 Tax=Bacillus sp. T3 TaxID=467262 RepID=UPI002980DA3D|nr:hypothetical protein [Bacillus sp. T3]